MLRVIYRDDTVSPPHIYQETCPTFAEGIRRLRNAHSRVWVTLHDDEDDTCRLKRLAYRPPAPEDMRFTDWGVIRLMKEHPTTIKELVDALEWLHFAVRDSGIEWEQQSQLSQAMPNAHAALARAKANRQPTPKEDKPLDGLPVAARFPRWKERP